MCRTMACRLRGVVLGAGIVAMSVSLLSGCSQEMLKATPFGTDEHDVALGPVEDRIALWPLVYYREPALSILWPIGEVTDDSWAVRPFIASYPDNYDILWPLIHIDLGEGDGFVAPVFWWGSAYFTAFPLVFVDIDDERVLLFPIAHINHSDDRPSFWSLVFGLRPDAEDGWLYTPLYWTMWENRGEWTQRAHISPALLSAFWRDSEQRPQFFSLLYIHGDEGDFRFKAVPPVLTAWGSRDPDSSWIFSPLYYGHRDAEDRFRLVPPLLSSWGRAGADSSWLYSPLFCYQSAPRAGLRIVPPALTAWGHDPYRFWFYNPLYSQHASEETTRRILPGLLSWHTDLGSRDGWAFHALLSTFGMTRTPQRSEEHLFPIYFRGSDADSSHLGVLPLYFETTDRDETQRLVPPLLSGWYGDGRGDESWHLLLSSIAWGQTLDPGGEVARSFHRFLPFYASATSPHGGSLTLPFLLYHSNWRGEKYRQWSVALALARYKETRTRTSHYVAPFYWYVETRPEPKLEDSRRPSPPSIKRRPGEAKKEVQEGGSVAASDEVVETTDLTIFPLFFDRDTKEFADGRRYRRTRVLWRFWHDEETDTRRSIDVFPFITYDREEDESLTWSWLYKVLRYERRGDEKTLTLCFVPIRWGGLDDSRSDVSDG